MTQELPVFSIVVPSYRRPGQLAACLQAIAQLDHARERFEVIVVEDGTNTPAKAAAASFDDRLNLTLLAQSHSGPATARNSGAMRAKGKFLAFTDDDCMPTKRWLQSLAVRFDQTPDDLIGGKTINVSDDPYARTYQVILVVNVYRGSGLQRCRWTERQSG